MHSCRIFLPGVFFLLAVLAACRSGHASDGQVYGAVGFNLQGHSNEGSFLLIPNQTIDIAVFQAITGVDKDSLPKDIEKYYPSMAKSAITAFIEANKMATAFPNPPPLGLPFHTVPAEPLWRNILNNEWTSLSSQYPGAIGLVAYSRIGYSVDGFEALVFASYTSFRDHDTQWAVVHVSRQQGSWKRAEIGFQGRMWKK